MKLIPVTFYYIGFFFTFIIGLLQTKILTTILTPSEYGELQLIIPILGWVLLIGCVGSPQFIIRFYSRDKLNIYKESLFVSTIGTLLLGLFACFFIYHFSFDYVHFNPSIRFGLIFLLAVFIQQFIVLIKALIRVQERHVFYNAIIVCIKISVLIGVISFLLLFSMSNIEEYLLGLFVGSTAILMLIIWYYDLHFLYKWKKPSFVTIKKILSYGLPIVGIMLMGDLLTNLNRYIIFIKLDNTSVAKYAIGSMITSLCFVVIYEPLNTILHPRVFKMWDGQKKQNSRKVLSRFINLYLIVGIIIFGLAVRHEDILINIISNMNYRMPEGCFLMLLLSNLIFGIYRFLSIHYYLEKNTKELGLLFLISILITFTITWFLVNIQGLMGAVISVLLGKSILTIMVWFRSKNNLCIKILPKYLIPSAIIALIFIFLPILSAWDISSPWRWVDFILSGSIAIFSTYLLYSKVEKHTGTSLLSVN